MSVNNIDDDSLGTSSRGYLKTTKFNTGSIRLLLFVVYFYFLIFVNAQLVDKVKHYHIKGETTKEFTLNWFRIQNTQGFAGYCLWQPKMNHSYIQTRRGYKATKLDLKVYVTLTLPRPHYPKNMPTMTRFDFSERVQEIYLHEYTHRAYKLQFYNEFMREFNQLPAARTVGGLYDMTNKLLWKHYERTKAKDAYFDRNGHK